MAKFPAPLPCLFTATLILTFLQGGYLIGRHSAASPYEVTITQHVDEDATEKPPSKPLPTENINLSTASIEELQTLPDIGPTRAAALVAWRDENGPFSTSNDVLSVPGIGEKTFASIKDYIIFQ